MLSDYVLAYFRKLEDPQINNTTWMHAHKDLADLVRGEFLGVVDECLGLLVPLDKQLVGISAKDCLFRVNRDIRFSQDKRPYKTFISSLLGPGGKKSTQQNGYACYYLHIEPDNKSFFGGGLYNPPKTARDTLQQSLINNYEQLQTLLQTKKFAPLLAYMHFNHTRIPKKHAHHPVKELLYLKNLYFQIPLTDSAVCSPTLIPTLMRYRKKLVPLNQLLNSLIDSALYNSKN